MPAPLVEVTIAQTHADGTTDQEALLTLDPSLVTQGLWTATLPAGFSNTIQFLASGANPGVLEPGESIQVPIYYAGWEQPWDNTYPDFQYEYGVEQTTDTTPIPWDTVQQEFQPADLDTTAWDAVLPGVETLVGNTWGDFVRALDDNASYLGHLGEDVTDIYQLWTSRSSRPAGLARSRCCPRDRPPGRHARPGVSKWIGSSPTTSPPARSSAPSATAGSGMTSGARRSAWTTAS